MTSTEPSQVISVRLAEPAASRLRTVAAARGETVQFLVQKLVETFLSDARGAPRMATIAARLQDQAPALRARGVVGLWVFGSVARGEAELASDVDLLADFAPESDISLVGLASLRAELSDLLGVPADLVERTSLRPSARVEVEQDAVRVL